MQDFYKKTVLETEGPQIRIMKKINTTAIFSNSKRYIIDISNKISHHISF